MPKPGFNSGFIGSPKSISLKTIKGNRQALIRHFLRLGVDPNLMADLMFLNMEIAQSFSSDMHKIREAFSKSMLRSCEQAVNYIDQDELISGFFSPHSKNWTDLNQFEKLTDQRN